MCQKSKNINSVVYRYNYHTATCNSLSVKFHFGRISTLESSSEKPYQNRLFFCYFFSTCPYVQIQTVLIHGNFRIHMPLTDIHVITDSRDALHGNRSKAIAFTNSIPVFTGLGCSPSVFSYRRSRKRDSLKCSYPRVCGFNTFHPSIFCPYCSQHNSYLR